MASASSTAGPYLPVLDARLASHRPPGCAVLAPKNSRRAVTWLLPTTNWRAVPVRLISTAGRYGSAQGGDARRRSGADQPEVLWRPALERPLDNRPPRRARSAKGAGACWSSVPRRGRAAERHPVLPSRAGCRRTAALVGPLAWRVVQDYVRVLESSAPRRGGSASARGAIRSSRQRPLQAPACWTGVVQPRL